MTNARKIGAVILAAGRSKRMGPGNKLTATIDDAPLLIHCLRAVMESRADPVVVVTGHDAAAVCAILTDFDVTIAANPDYAEGMASSIRTGVAALPTDCDGALICLGDMPGVSADHINRLIAAFDPDSAPVCAPVFDGRRGNPVLWGRAFFPELLALSGDMGAREMVQRHAPLVRSVSMADDGVLIDIDTPDALAAQRTHAKRNSDPSDGA